MPNVVGHNPANEFIFIPSLSIPLFSPNPFKPPHEASDPGRLILPPSPEGMLGLQSCPTSLMHMALEMEAEASHPLDPKCSSSAMCLSALLAFFL